MVTRRERGFTLMEVVISLALFGVFLFIIGQLTSEMRYYEKRYPVNFMAHPQVNAVIARLRKDVYDSTEYPETYETYTMGKQTLILETLEARAWKDCECSVCREIGVEVIIFRGADRNLRRGFHNLSVFAQRLRRDLERRPSTGSRR